METDRPFEIAELRRDWIEGCPGAVFYEQVRSRIGVLEAGGEAVRRQGVLIAERDPIAFMVAFLSAVYLRVPVILANPDWRSVEWDAVAGLVRPAVHFGESAVSAGPPVELSAERLDPGAILIPTGGSTGGVRFAVHRWESLAASWEGLRVFLGASPYSACCMLPLFHVSGLMQVVRAFLSKDGCVAFWDFKQLQAGVFPPSDLESLCLSLVPTQLRRLINAGGPVETLRRVRAIFVGGAPMPRDLMEQARVLRLPIVLSYGMTETAAMVVALASTEFWAGSEAAGRPLAHAEVEIVGADGALCGAGVPGRLRVRATSLFQGYYGVAASAPGVEGFLTGDEGYYDPEGRLHVIGRADRLIISGGEKVDPKEVERAILASGVAETVLVVGWPDEEWGQKLVAFYTVGQIQVDPRAGEESLRSDLVRFKIPKLMIPVESLPFNERGKLDHPRMRALVESFSRG